MASTTTRPRHRATAAVHAGERAARGSITPVSTPIYHAATFLYDTAAELDGAFEADPSFVYSRHGNPTVAALETALATLEGGAVAVACASGMAALHAALLACELGPGDRVLASQDLYGATGGLLNTIFAPLGVEAGFVDAGDLEATERALARGRARVLLVETLSNPLLRVADLPALADLAHRYGARLIVDATFTPPVLCRPLEHGADLVTHSTTKYLGGHSDLVGGFAATNDPTIAERLYFLQKSLGAVPGPFDSWLVLRGVKTLAVRMREHCANARRIADFLESHAAVERVRYPGLASHPNHDVARAQMSDFGGMISFELAGSKEDTLQVLRSTTIWQLAESLGGVESLIEHPGLMTHASTADSAFPVPENLIRLSVGIEAADDLIADLEQALAVVRTPSTA